MVFASQTANQNACIEASTDAVISGDPTAFRVTLHLQLVVMHFGSKTTQILQGRSLPHGERHISRWRARRARAATWRPAGRNSSQAHERDGPSQTRACCAVPPLQCTVHVTQVHTQNCFSRGRRCKYFSASVTCLMRDSSTVTPATASSCRTS